MAFIFPDIDPVIVNFSSNSPFKITWYSASYVLGIVLGWAYIKYLNRNTLFNKPIDNKQIDDLITAIILGIVIGGRLGYVLFYDLQHNIKDPLNIFRTWEGGMSFHGGLLGVVIASLIYCRIHKLKFFRMIDLVACATPIGLFFGRIANFINAELQGRVTTINWGVIFPGQSHPRHASQLYESFLEGIVLFIILYLVYTKTKAQKFQGIISGIFLIMYSVFRSIIENFREPDEHIGFIIGNITMGQILSLPMLLSGLLIILYSIKSKQYEEHKTNN